jgi:HEAT repeat protein
MNLSPTQRRNVVLLFGLLLAIVGLACFFLSHREPVYQGKRWSEWFKSLDHLPPCTAEKQIFSGQQFQAVEALRQIGAQAMPLIERELRAKDSAFKLKFMGWARQQSTFKFDYSPASVRRDKAMAVCAWLGTNAAPAVPHLIELLKNPDPTVRASAVCTLGSVGSEAAIPHLIESAKDANILVRCFAIPALGKMTGQPDTMLPTLIEATRDTSAAVRLQAVAALERFTGSSAAVVTPLLKALEDGDASIRPYAARALGKCPGQTNLIVPALLKAVRDSDAPLRLQATVALSQLGIDLSEASDAIRAEAPDHTR